jgi:transposase
VQKSAGEVLNSIFWDQDGILFTDYLAKGQTINAEYYSSLLVQLKDSLKEIRREVIKRVLFLHNNAPAHQALATQKILAYLGFQCLDYPPYSPELAPSDYHSFPELKKQLKAAIFHLMRRSLLPRRSGWTDNLLNFLRVACKS